MVWSDVVIDDLLTSLMSPSGCLRLIASILLLFSAACSSSHHPCFQISSLASHCISSRRYPVTRRGGGKKVLFTFFL